MNNTDVSSYLTIHTVIRNAKLKGLSASRFNYDKKKLGIFSIEGDNNLLLVSAKFENNGITKFDSLTSNNKFISRGMEDFKRRVCKMASFPVIKIHQPSQKEEFIDLFNNEDIQVCMIASYTNRRFNNLFFAITLRDYSHFFIYNGKKIECRHFTFRYDERGLFINQTSSLDILINDFDRTYPGVSLERDSIISIREVNSMIYL